VSHFVAIIADEALEDGHISACNQIAHRLRAQAGGLSVDEVASRSAAAAIMSPAHARCAGFAKDEGTGSWLACIGNPLAGGGRREEEGGLGGHLLGDWLRGRRNICDDLEGVFAMVIHDGRDRSTHIITDPLGLQHIYEARLPGARVYATSSMAIASASGAHLDAAAAATYFQMGHLLGEMTLFKEASKVKGAAHVCVRDGTRSEETYWRAESGRGDAGVDEWAEEIAAALRETMERALSSGAETTVELTGGLDSRLNFVTALATGRPFAAWTIGDVSARDTETAERLARMAGVRHYVTPVLEEVERTFEDDFRLIHELTDGQMDCLTVIASPSANRQMTGRRAQSVSGAGGEALRGCFYRSKAWFSDDVSVERLTRWQLCLNTPYCAGIFARDYADAGGERVRGVVQSHLTESQGEEAHRRLERFHFGPVMEAAGGRSMSFNGFFYRQVAPFASRRLVKAVMSMPAAYKRRGIAARRAVEMSSREIADVPLATGLPGRPLRLADAGRVVASYGAYGRRVARKVLAKAGLLGEAATRDVGLASVMREKMTDIARRELAPEKMASAGIYDADALRKFVERNINGGMPELTAIGLVYGMELTFRYVGGNLGV